VSCGSDDCGGGECSGDNDECSSNDDECAPIVVTGRSVVAVVTSAMMSAVLVICKHTRG